MRIHRLELQAFGPFAERENIDFSELNEAGLFLLDGPTGAGKSTVLAGICFALYGTVPGGRSAEGLASTQSPMGTRPEVLLDFTIGARNFEILRWPKYRRPAKRRRQGESGISLTEEKAGAVLRELRDGVWAEVSVRADEIGQLLRQELYLDAEQFMRVVLLPQGEFAAFLRAGSQEKETLLRKLFGTGRYDGVATSLAARQQALEQAVRRDRDLVATARQDLLYSLHDGLGEGWWGSDADPEGWPDAEFASQSTAAVAAALESSRAARQDAVVEASRAQRALDAVSRTRQDLQSAQAWADRTHRLEEKRDRTVSARSAVERHREAAPVNRRAAEARAAEDAHREHRAALDRALERAWADEHCLTWDGAGSGARTGDEESRDLSSRFDDLRQRAERDLDRLADRERDAAALTRAEAERARLADSIEVSTRTAAAAEAERDMLVAAQRSLHQRLEELASPAAGLDPARLQLEQATARREAARAHERDHHARAAAEDAVRTATDQAQSAVDAWQDIVERRLAGAASLLAAALEDGVACQVCGSVDHPFPAVPGDAEISAEAQGRARQDMDEAIARRRRAETAVDEARRTAESSRLASAGLSPHDAEVALGQARDAVSAAQQAVRDLEETRAAVQQNERDQLAQAQAAETARAGLAAAQTRLTAADEDLDRLRRVVEEALGGRTDLAEVRRELEAAKQLVDAVVGAAAAEATHRSLTLQAAEHLTTELGASPFATVEDVLAAVLPAEEEARLAAAVRDWDHEEARVAELAASDSVQRGRELLRAGTEPPPGEEVAQHEAAVDAATQHRDAAGERVGVLESLHRQTVRQAGVLTEVAGRSAGQRADLEETDGLLKLVRGAGENSYKMTLGSYVLAGRLEEVVAAATERLLGMTQGRYELRHDDSVRGRGIRGLDITVFDRYTEDERAASTLSGGETFMASLALALGLADTVQAEAGGVDMDTLFVDEGFGSLDTATLADVMDVLDGLQAGGRTIGIVSHVDRMKQDIGYRLEVQKTQQGSHLRVRVPDRAGPVRRA
ncbi:SMC family ATPase [Citricoccus sp.]|uniref:SMC family ATPase n=1 Tax=Citricoccus sp. TaxID=1978372 RepID=UPI0028BDCCAF|nr:SMC family ATPase [Citricoccus sp.]